MSCGVCSDDDYEKEIEIRRLNSERFGYKEGWNDCVREIIKNMKKEYDGMRVISMLDKMWKE